MISPVFQTRYASHLSETHAKASFSLFAAMRDFVHPSIPALVGTAHLMKRLPDAILFTASFTLLSARGRVWTGGLPPKGPSGTTGTRTPGFCPAVGSGVSRRCVNHKEGKWNAEGGRLGPRWMPWAEKALPRHDLPTRRPTARPVATGVSMVRKGAAPAQIWSIAGLKTAGAQIWGALTKVVTPQKLFLFVLFQVVYTRLLRLLYKLQVQMWRLIRKHDPQPYEESVLGFLEPRLRMLSRVLVIAYFLNSAVRVSIASGWNANPKLAKVLSDVVYCWYAGYFVDEAKRFFLPVWIPSLKADKRKGFIYNRSLSVLTWAICMLTVSEVISAYLRIPITSTLAFGGIGGLAIGLAGKDVLSNFFGGLMLLLAEPFIPGDMVTFQRNGVRCEGRVERVGWYQTRMRGRDTRPTYVPNGMFADTMVTNMDRITHRKFESNCQIRYADSHKVVEILQAIKAALKDVPNVDLLSPFRVHLTDFADTGLKITIVCYFATKSFDEFLYLQQLALLEVTRVVQTAGATMTSVLHVDTSDPTPIPVSKLQDIVSPPAAAMAVARDRDGSGAVFEEQDVARAIPLNGGTDDPNRTASANGNSGPRGGSV